MAIITGYTAEQMEKFNNASVVSGAVNTSGSLILQTRGGTVIDAGNVKGPKGDNVSIEQLAAFVPRWKAAVAYKVGDQVITPNNEVATANSAHTSSAAFNTDIPKWNSAESIQPYAHVGKTDGFQSISASAAQKVIFPTPQELHGGFAFDSTTSSLIVPRTGRYRAHMKAVFSGGGQQGLNAWGAFVNGQPVPASMPTLNKLHGSMSKLDSNDIAGHSTGIVNLTAGDKVGMYAQSNATIWGNSGYNGAHLELEWIGPLFV